MFLSTVVLSDFFSKPQLNINRGLGHLISPFKLTV